MWNYNREDDTSRYGRKGPDNFAALATILADLFKGEKEDFTRLKCRPLFGCLLRSAGQVSGLGDAPYSAEPHVALQRGKRCHLLRS